MQRDRSFLYIDIGHEFLNAGNEAFFTVVLYFVNIVCRLGKHIGQSASVGPALIDDIHTDEIIDVVFLPRQFG